MEHNWFLWSFVIAFAHSCISFYDHIKQQLTVFKQILCRPRKEEHPVTPN